MNNLATTELRHQTLQMFAQVCGARERSRNARFYRRNSARIVDNLFFKLSRVLKVRTLLECGAHEATASRRFLEGGGNRSIAIEANPEIFKIQTAKSAAYGVEILNIGLADKPGHMTFNIPEKNLAAASFLSKGKASDTCKIETTTIDLLIESQAITGRLALWVDVEGFSYQVLSGATETLEASDTCVLVVEMEDAQLWQGQKTMSDVGPIIEGYGFVPVLCDIQFVDQFNVVYIREKFLADCKDIIEDANNAMKNLIASNGTE